ncbi:hypothetical protein BGZ82_009798 [Podila clonocystis]|nr:hypothetical protein BGZ82_009798 [Podila clonocystis]
MASRASIIFYYDLISPYTYMGFKVFKQLRQQWPSVDVTLKPVLLGGIMASVNNKPLFEFPSKRNHMDEYFVHGRNISQTEVIQTALAPIVGGRVHDMIQLAADPQIKKIFKDNTDEAVAKGAFGAPTLLVKQAGSGQEHLFFGSDRFESIAGFLNIPYPGLASLKSSNRAKL